MFILVVLQSNQFTNIIIRIFGKFNKRFTISFGSFIEEENPEQFDEMLEDDEDDLNDSMNAWEEMINERNSAPSDKDKTPMIRDKKNKEQDEGEIIDNPNSTSKKTHQKWSIMRRKRKQ
jgi:hypothetical protein